MLTEDTCGPKKSPATNPLLLSSRYQVPIRGPAGPFRLPSHQAGSVSNFRLNSTNPSGLNP